MRIRKNAHSDVNMKSTRTHSYSRIKEHVVECGRSAKAGIHKLSKWKENRHTYHSETPYKRHLNERTPIRTRLRYRLSLKRRERNNDIRDKSSNDCETQETMSPVENIYRLSPYPIFETSRDDDYSRPNSSNWESCEQKQIQLVKTNSLQSLKNTIKMGLEAESSGINALNMLNCQHDVLSNIDKNLDGIKVYNRMANDNIDQLKGYKKYSTSSPMQYNADTSIFYDKYYSPVKRKAHNYNINYPCSLNMSSFEDITEMKSVNWQSQNAKYTPNRHSFELGFSSPDDDLDSSISKALDEISCISRKLRFLAQETSCELDCQLERLSCTEDAIQRVSCKVKKNTESLDNIT